MGMVSASPTCRPRTPEGPCQVTAPCQAGDGVPSSLEQGRDFYRRKQFAEPTRREVKGGSPPLPSLLMCFQFGNPVSAPTHPLS